MKPPAKRQPRPIPAKVLRKAKPPAKTGGVDAGYYLRALSKALG